MSINQIIEEMVIDNVNYNFRAIRETCEKIPPRTMQYVSMMIDEEMGELARAINRPERCDESALSELCDVIISVYDLMWLIDKDAISAYSNKFFSEIEIDVEGIDPYDQFQVMKKHAAEINIYQPSINNYWKCFDLLLACIHMIYLLADESKETKLLVNQTFITKCLKWERNCKTA